MNHAHSKVLVDTESQLRYFSKDSYDLSTVLVHANAMEKKYTELRELTCPQDDDG